MIIYKCDKCGKTVDGKKGDRNPSAPKGWYTITHGQYSNGVQYHICDGCRKALGIPDNYNQATAYVGDQLIELLCEIVREEIQNNTP